MKKWPLFLFLLCAILPNALLADTVRLTVLSYNIHHAEGTDGRLDVARIANVIAAASPDLVALQEVDRNTERSERVDQAAELARLSGMHMAYAKTIDFQGGQYGIAVLSRYPILSTNIHPLPCSEGYEPRVILETKVAHPRFEQSPFFFLATHLDHHGEDHDRMAAVPVVEEWAANHAEAPALLLGDLNDTPDSRVLRSLRKGWKTAGEGSVLLTSPAENPRRQIDYVLYRPAERWNVVETRVLDEPVASDHRPVVSVLDLEVSSSR